MVRRACRILSRINEAYTLNLGLRKIKEETTSTAPQIISFHRSVKNTNIAHRRVSDHRNTAS